MGGGDSGVRRTEDYKGASSREHAQPEAPTCSSHVVLGVSGAQLVLHSGDLGTRAWIRAGNGALQWGEGVSGGEG